MKSHTSSAITEPNVGASWADYWKATGDSAGTKTWALSTYYKKGNFGVYNVTVRNNIARFFPSDSDNPPNIPFYLNVQVDHNYEIDSYNPELEFVDYANGDIHLRLGSNFIDQGTSSGAPSDDLQKNPRPQGEGFDIGAYEYIGSEPTNNAPVLDAIGAQLIGENGVLTITLDATDEDFDPLTYDCTLPSGATFDSPTFTWKPTYKQAGVYYVTASVTDGEDWDWEYVTITVTNTPQGFLGCR